MLTVLLLLNDSLKKKPHSNKEYKQSNYEQLVQWSKKFQKNFEMLTLIKIPNDELRFATNRYKMIIEDRNVINS